jgi:hypothetical protein
LGGEKISKIALIGPSYHEHQSSVRNMVKYKGACWSLWTYCHKQQEKIGKLLDQINDPKIGYFNIYVYNSETQRKDKTGIKKSSPGNGLVDYKEKVINFQYRHRMDESPEKDLSYNDDIVNCKVKKSCGWYYTTDVLIIKAREWTSFNDYDTGEPIPPINETGLNLPNHEWIYIEDID